MNHEDGSDVAETEAEAEAASDGGALNEDWLATIVGLAILALALLGLIPDAVLW